MGEQSCHGGIHLDQEISIQALLGCEDMPQHTSTERKDKGSQCQVGAGDGLSEGTWQWKNQLQGMIRAKSSKEPCPQVRQVKPPSRSTEGATAKTDGVKG